MTTDNIGLYIHIPFCIRKCAYCDFASFGGVHADVRARYIDRLCEEIESYYSDNKIGVDTIFFGGGTPSLLQPNELSRILESVHKSFNVTTDAEITMEMNPGTITFENVRAYVALGVNRASIGCQSFNQNGHAKPAPIPALFLRGTVFKTSQTDCVGLFKTLCAQQSRRKICRGRTMCATAKQSTHLGMRG